MDDHDEVFVIARQILLVLRKASNSDASKEMTSDLTTDGERWVIRCVWRLSMTDALDETNVKR